jgi:hypothetical protein
VRDDPTVGRDPEERLNEAYRALGHFVVKFSYIGVTMIQWMVPTGGPAEKVAGLYELHASALINRWNDEMQKDPRLTKQDRGVLHVLRNEAARLQKVRNDLMHTWWTERSEGGLSKFSLKNDPPHRWITSEGLESLAFQAAVVADAITKQCGLLATSTADGFRRQLAVTGKGDKRVVWVQDTIGSPWWCTDGREGTEPYDVDGWGRPVSRVHNA